MSKAGQDRRKKLKIAKSRLMAGRLLTDAEARLLGRFAFIEYGAMPGNLEYSYPELYEYFDIDLRIFDTRFCPLACKENHQKICYWANHFYWQARDRFLGRSISGNGRKSEETS